MKRPRSRSTADGRPPGEHISHVTSAVDTVLVGIGAVVPGTIDQDTGGVMFALDSATSYGVVDEIACRVWLSSGRVVTHPAG